MPTLLDFRRRIRSVKNSQQITRAMKFVAAARLRRAQEAALAARPYAKELARVLRSTIARIQEPQHPLLERREKQEGQVGWRARVGAQVEAHCTGLNVSAREMASAQLGASSIPT